MSRFAVKLVVMTLLLIAASMFISSGKVLAATCPSGTTAPTGWGVTTGQHSNAMAGLIVRAHNSDNGNLINTYYQLNSSLPNVNHPINGHDPDERIFQYPPGSGGRDKQHWFTTGENLHDGSSTFACGGWSVLGPGNAANEVGNGWVIDCGEFVDGSYHPSLFWISSIPKPGGQDGHWEVQVDGATNTPNLDTQAMQPFGAVNGDNRRVDLIWHPQPPPHHEPDLTSECTILDITDGGDATINGNHFNSNEIRTAVRVYDSSGQVLVHEDGQPNNFLYLNNETRIWRQPGYHPRGVTLTVQVYRQYWHNTGTKNSSGNWIYRWDDYADQTRTHTCYSAGCGVSQIIGNVPDHPDAVISGTNYTVVMKVHNNGPLTLNNPTMNGVAVDNAPLNQYDEGYASFVITAPSGGPQNYTVNFTLNDVVSGLASCPATVAVYQSFTLEPHATLTYGTAENPGNIGYSTYIQNNSSAAISAPTTSAFTATPYGGGARCANAGPVNSNGPYNPGGPNYTINPANCTPSSVSAGDQYCTEIDLTSYNQGYVGPGGNLAGVSLNGSATDKHCFTVINKPYFKAYGGGVSAGGNFKQSDGTCNSGSGGLLAGWNDNSGGQARGASSQLSALAFIKITGFASAQASASTSSPPGTALSFANTQLPSGGQTSSSVDSPTLGGNYNPGGSRCLTDVLPPSGTAAKPDGYVQPGISGISNSQSVFVDGDVYINGNITYANNWTAGSKPSFALRATGNIYIAPGVTELDGLYIGKNKIYTCASNNGGGNFTPMSGTTLYTNCNKQLVVYGSFVAQQVNLMRTYGSLRNATSGELTTAGSHSCSYSGGPGNSPVCAGEVFIFSPALYMTNPAIRPPSNGATQYDAITSLPPVL